MFSVGWVPRNYKRAQSEDGTEFRAVHSYWYCTILIRNFEINKDIEIETRIEISHS
jgi:hypothetical protein